MDILKKNQKYNGGQYKKIFGNGWIFLQYPEGQRKDICKRKIRFVNKQVWIQLCVYRRMI